MPDLHDKCVTGRVGHAGETRPARHRRGVIGDSAAAADPHL